MLNLTTARVTGWGGLFSQDPASLTNTAQRLSCYLQEVELSVEIPGSVETRSVTTSTFTDISPSGPQDRWEMSVT